MDDFASSSSRFHHHDYYNNSNNTRIRDFDDEQQQQQQQQDQEMEEESCNDSNNNNCSIFVEKEHMFDKVVTPSDVGKLNRLVIPKQHAEKYFPLDSSSNEKGLLLNFEDRCGKLWRFRYSYWTSSQSYVMTKGWSRFVKDKRLDAGDIVSFQRPLHRNQDRFFIDWRRRPPHPAVDMPFHFHRHDGGTGAAQFPPPPHHHHHFQLHSQWNNNPVATPLSLQRDHVLHLPQYNNNVSLFHNTYNHHPHHNRYLDGSYGGASVFYHLRSPIAPPQIESVPVVADGNGGNGGGGSGIGRTSAAKTTLRLFGVDMECEVSDDECDVATTSKTMSSSSQFHVYNGMPMPMLTPMTMQMPTSNNNISTMDFFEKGKSSMSSMSSFDFGA